MTGRLQIYTGDGKGKTTAAVGLAVRAAGAGLRVYFGQFLKSGRSSECRLLSRLAPALTVEAYGRGRLIRGRPAAADRDAAAAGLRRLRDAITGGRYDVVIADELIVAMNLGLLPAQDVLDMLEARPRGVELVLTGRGAAARLLRRADLVTEMRNVRHYFDRGVKARKGIER